MNTTVSPISNVSEMRLSRFSRCIFLALVMGCIADSGLIMAQQNRGKITGRVTDRSGAVVPSAQIQIVDTETNVQYAFVTNDEGLYTAPAIPPGAYKVVATKEGFSTIVRQPVLLTAQIEVRVDFTLEPG